MQITIIGFWSYYWACEYTKIINCCYFQSEFFWVRMKNILITLCRTFTEVALNVIYYQ